MNILTGGVWDVVWLGNSAGDYVVALVVFLLSVVVLKVVQSVAIARTKRFVEKSKTKIDDALAQAIATLKPPFYWFLAFWIGLQFLELQGVIEKIVDTVLLVWVVYQVVLALQILVEYFIKARFIKEDDRSSEIVSSIVTGVTRIVLWVLATLFVLQNLGVEVTSLIAGVGIGGLAVALAAQKIFEDLFSSLAIYFDEPFEPGDFIKVGDVSGTVQKVGVKTTRIKALSGEEVTVPNKEITSKQVYNYRRMVDRRVEFAFGVTYDTGQVKLKKIPKMVKEAILSESKTEFDRANFKEFGDSALLFEVVYKLNSRKFKTYRRKHEKILLAIKRAFEEEGIEMAFPTQTVHVVKS